MRHALALCATLAIASPAAAAPFAYAATAVGNFGILDLGSGAFVHCGYSNRYLFGLAVGRGGLLYGMDTGNFYRINPHTGEATWIAGAGAYRISMGSAAHVIYTVDSNAHHYIIDPETGVETAINGGASDFVNMLSVGAPQLYESAIGGFYKFYPRDEAVYRLNQVINIEWNALVWTDAGFYGIGIPQNDIVQYIYTIDPKTGLATKGPTIPSIVADQISGVAPTPPDHTGTCRQSAAVDPTAGLSD